jgi:hypothetical protein
LAANIYGGFVSGRNKKKMSNVEVLDIWQGLHHSTFLQIHHFELPVPEE